MTEAFDVVILGAGINGAGLFRELCAQGVPCLIVDRADFGSGTSAAPSRLIHGGLKYLETGEFRLVAQSALERNLLLRNAPHMVAPLATLIPLFSWTRGIGAALRTLLGATTAPRSRGALLVKAGLSLYDVFGRRARVLPRHRLLRRAQALREMPALTPAIVAAGTYHDARIAYPERLVLELVLDGLALEPRSEALSYTELTGTGDGALSFGGRTVRPRVVVNAAGPWIDRVNAALGAPSRLIGGTRGSHVLLANDALVAALGGRMVYFEADDGRICLVFEHLGRALVGSTDIPDADPDGVRATEAEIDYLVASVAALMPGVAVSKADIVYAYSGIRPLPASDATAPGLVSRDHSAPVAEPAAGRSFPIVSLVGGKWTTFRGFAEEVGDLVLSRLGASRRVSTRGMAIGGGAGYPATEAARAAWTEDVRRISGFAPARIATLLARYGTRARGVAAHAGAWTDADRLPDACETSRAEIDWIVRHERVARLEDVVLRRTALAITGALTLRDLEAVAEVTGAALGWTDARRDAETRALAARLRERNLMRL